jgi:uncharacterized alpha/beta hydrolase family protein
MRHRWDWLEIVGWGTVILTALALIVFLVFLPLFLKRDHSNNQKGPINQNEGSKVSVPNIFENILRTENK